MGHKITAQKIILYTILPGTLFSTNYNKLKNLN